MTIMSSVGPVLPRATAMPCLAQKPVFDHLSHAHCRCAWLENGLCPYHWQVADNIGSYACRSDVPAEFLKIDLFGNMHPGAGMLAYHPYNSCQTG
jgi:hypothetical protein